MTQLNCITGDDEPLALGLVSAFVEQTPFLKLAGSYGNAVEALNAIHREPIDLVFLDIQMPDLNGMDLARVISQHHAASPTRIIFTTAFNQFAVDGYKVDALGYLLKPFGYDEFLNAALKAKHFFDRLQDATQDQDQKDNFLFVKSDYKLTRIDFNAILYIESVKDYVKIHLAAPAKPITALSSLKAIEEKLPANQFIRVHRSFIVSISKVDSISRNAVHIGNMDISVGDLYKESFKDLISRWN